MSFHACSEILLHPAVLRSDVAKHYVPLHIPLLRANLVAEYVCFKVAVR